MALTRPRQVVAVLGSAQTLAWASSYYLPAILAAPMAREFGLPVATVFAAFSLALGVSALVGPVSGRLIDRHGGRPVLMGTNALFAAGLVALALARGPWSLFAAWALLGVAMGSGLYEAAFATLVRQYGRDARSAITGITLIAGFASTVGWPLSAWMATQFGWRGACLGWAGLHLLVGLPLNAWLPSLATPAEAMPAPAASAAPQAPPAPHAAPAPVAAAGGPSANPVPGAAPAPAAAGTATTAALLAFVFAATMFTSTAMATHLPRLLQAAGVGLATAVGVAALIGPSQVVARLLEFGLLRRLHPLISARLAALTHPLGAALLLLAGPAAAPLFAVLHGGGNGILTITKGTLPLVLFGAAGYGARQGWLVLPARFAQAAAPWFFGLALERWGVASLGLTSALGLTALAALLLLRARPRAPVRVAPAAGAD